MAGREGSGYELDYMPIMDLLWGEGFIAPGGEGNVDRIVQGVDLRGKRVLELGSGAGGGTLVLAGKHGASVVGLELEQPLVEHSRQLAEKAGLSAQTEFRCVEPGPLAIDDDSFDAFYTSGVLLHVEDRLALFRDVLRILKPGGMVLGYDWFVTLLSEDIRTWLKAAELRVFPDRVEHYAELMREAGFVDVSCDDASQWYLQEARQELEQLTGPLYEQAAKLTSPGLRDMVLREWQTMNQVLQSGELRTGYFRGSKPG